MKRIIIKAYQLREGAMFALGADVALLLERLVHGHWWGALGALVLGVICLAVRQLGVEPDWSKLTLEQEARGVATVAGDPTILHDVHESRTRR